MNDNVPHRTTKVLEKDVDGELIIINAKTNELVSLSDSARAIWELIDDRRTVGDIVERLCTDYGVSPDDPVEDDEPPETEGEVLAARTGTVKEEVCSFLELLAEKGLVTFSGEKKED